MNATDAEIYNAIDGSVYFAVADIEELASAIQRTATDPMAVVEVGKMYTAMVREVIKSQRERTAKRASENSSLLRSIAMPRYDLTEQGKQFVCSDEVCRNAGVGA